MNKLPKQVVDLLNQFLKRIKEIQEDGNISGNESYLALADSVDEQTDISELCEGIDLYYAERIRLKQSGLKAYKYFEQEAISLYRESNPNASDLECIQYLESIRQKMDEIMEQNASEFNTECSGGNILEVEELLSEMETKYNNVESN